MIKIIYTTFLFFCLAVIPLRAQFSIVEIMYNNPGEDLYEYVKVWNVSGADINLGGYSMSDGIEADFPDINLAFNDWFFVVTDSTAFVDAFDTFGYPVIQATGALNNGGETITLVDANGQIVDSVTYSDDGGWPTFADGEGSSIQFCGTTGQDKNDPDLWSLNPSTLGLTIDGQPFYGLLGDISFQCNQRGTTSFFRESVSVLESDGVVNIPLYIDRALENSVSVSLTDASGTAISGDDYQLVTTTITSDTDTMDVFNVMIEITDDADLEPDETFTLTFEPFSDEYLSLTNSIELTIIDNDTPLTEGLILTGVWDAQPGFAGTKGAEFYALNDIPDLSVFGVGVVNNGNGTDGVEFTFPAINVAAGTFIYLAEEEAEFMDYFGFAPDATFTEVNVNGDDAIELFENAQPLDVFGDVDMDGSGTPWEYLDGWAYRVSGTLQDSSTFNQGNWTYSGVDALEGPATNAEATSPFPIGTYSPMAASQVVANDVEITLSFGAQTGNINVTSNDIIPGDITSLNIVTPASTITTTVNADFTIEYVVPDGFSGVDSFVYEVSDGSTSDEAIVTIIVEEALNYPLLDIGAVTTEDGLGMAESIGTSCELIGNVYGVNLSTIGTLFTIIDDNGDGIAVFNGDGDLGYTVTEGDIVSVKGTITQFSGLTEIVADEITLVGQGANLLPPAFVTVLNESTESQLITIEGQYEDISQWGGGNSGFNFTVVNSENEYVVRIDNDVDLFLLPAPGDEAASLTITGIGGQFDSAAPFDEGYQILPRYESDIIFGPGANTKNVLGFDIDMYPNPASKILNLNSEEVLDELRISDALGRVMMVINNPNQQTEISVDDLIPGIYTIQCIKDNNSYAYKLLVN